MIAVLTGDIIDSSHHSKALWLPALRGVLAEWGTEGEDFEIYRGDEFQLRLKAPGKALQSAISIKARLKATADTDIRIAIGLGDEQDASKPKDKTVAQDINFSAPITLNSGPAFIRSGRKLDELKTRKIHLGILSDQPLQDQQWNLLLRWVLLTADNWSSVSAEIVDLALTHPDLSQSEMATLLKVQQSAISQRLKRASFDLVSQTISFFDQKIDALCKPSKSL